MKYLIPILVLAVLSGCSNREPGIEYAPQMYHSIPLEPYSQAEYNEMNSKFFKNNGKNIIEPVAGTVARGKADYYYPYEGTEDGYIQAGQELQNPLEATDDVIEAGKALFQVNCQHCHGKNGDGKGTINNSEQYEGFAPDYKSRLATITQGQAYHSITFGRNNMGAHAYALTPNERWQVVTYIYTFLGGNEEEKAE